jgi:hypothetical protein
VIDFPMDGAPSEGCSTTTILAQLSIERDAGAGAVHTITLAGFTAATVFPERARLRDSNVLALPRHDRERPLLDSM